MLPRAIVGELGLTLRGIQDGQTIQMQADGCNVIGAEFEVLAAADLSR